MKKKKKEKIINKIKINIIKEEILKEKKIWERN
jgi:hypothetical protein